ncbi:MAG: hypothetical protein KDD44_01210 [Bdellovibrionales bacterium]|nr:hypothetical protein [Bdellovibrionales bacterium]
MQRTFPIPVIVLELARDNLLPAILFRTARAQCDADVLRAAGNRRLHLPPAEQRRMRLMVHELAERYDMDLELITSNPQYNALILTGIGAHHAGQLLQWRLLLEELMAGGALRVLVATGTVAAGVDFPARTVVITAHSRRGAEGYLTLSAAEFQQMSGRAGRRGKDTVGFCLIAPSLFCDARELLKVAKRPPEPLSSAYFPSPSTVLNLLRYRNVDDLMYTVERSLAAFVDRREAKEMRAEAQQLASQLPSDAEFERQPDHLRQSTKRERKRVRRLERQASELEVRQRTLVEQALAGLAQLGHVEDLSLSEKGYWAANLCTGLVLELAEMIEAKLFDGRSAEELAALVASIAGDSYRPYLSGPKSPISAEDERTIRDILERVGTLEMPGVQEGREFVPAAANTVLVWLQAEDWQQFRGLLILSGVAEGDAARLISQTADHLNQLTRLSESHPELTFRAEEAKRRLLRPPLTDAINVDSI